MEIDPEDFKQLVGLLQKLVETNIEPKQKTVKKKKQSQKQVVEEQQIEEDYEDEDMDVSSQPTNSVIKTANKKLKPARNNKGEFVNKFLSMNESSMHKDDSAIDKKLSKYPPTQRARQFRFVDAKCRVCGKTEQVPPGLVESINRYKCNKCSTSPG